jgi:hypothetical protein
VKASSSSCLYLCLIEVNMVTVVESFLGKLQLTVLSLCRRKRTCFQQRNTKMCSNNGCVAWAFMSAPLWAFIYCLGVAYSSDTYSSATISHCKVPNFAMSVSEATSVPDSSRLIWQIAVLSHVAPRILHARLMYETFLESLSKLEVNMEWWISWIYVDW